MHPFPRDTSPDSTLALLSEGYRFVMNRCERHGSDVFETRLMLRKAVCVMGEDAARMFYEPDRFTRKGAMPITTLMLLQDRGAAQTLDGEAHRWRKRMLMALMEPEAIRRLCGEVATEWRAALPGWETAGRVVLLDAVRAILCRAVCRWAGVPLTEGEAGPRTAEFAAMIDGAGAVGPRNWRGLLLRTRTERWARGLIEDVRAGRLALTEGDAQSRALHVIATHRGPDGNLLDTTTAAVELINILRPVVAIAHYVVFAALALHEHPEQRTALQDASPEELERFVQEVRRFYPFFPLVAGRVRTPFDWRGHRFAEGGWVLLDLYGTCHDPRIWNDPERFRPERFRGREPGAFTLIPQGGGGHLRGHRCAGEWITIEVVKTTVRLLTREMRYGVPAQDLALDLSRMPAMPRSRFVITDVAPRRKADAVLDPPVAWSRHAH